MLNLAAEPEHDACGVGFLADLSHRASHDVIRMSLEAAAAMAHRGARAADGRTGDGAGLLVETPRALYLKELTADHIRIPERHVGAVCLFLPRDFDDAANARAKVESAVRLADVAPLRWRVPLVNTDVLGEYARRTAPPYEQLLVRRSGAARVFTEHVGVDQRHAPAEWRDVGEPHGRLDLRARVSRVVEIARQKQANGADMALRNADVVGGEFFEVECPWGLY